jgi:hypothetical protein
MVTAMASDDPLEIMRKAMRLQQAIAKKELDKGERGNVTRATEASMAAASLAKEIAAAEYRLGINSSRPMVDKIEVEFVEGPGTAAERDRLKEENQLLRAQLETFRNQPDQSQPVAEPPPITPTPAPDAAPDNVIPLVESREQKIARLRRENGDVPQACRSAFSLDGILHHEGRGRFDFPTNRGGW